MIFNTFRFTNAIQKVKQEIEQRNRLSRQIYVYCFQLADPRKTNQIPLHGSLNAHPSSRHNRASPGQQRTTAELSTRRKIGQEGATRQTQPDVPRQIIPLRTLQDVPSVPDAHDARGAVTSATRESLYLCILYVSYSTSRITKQEQQEHPFSRACTLRARVS